MRIAAPLAFLIILFGSGPTVGSTAANGASPEPKVSTLSFTILRDGAPFGTHRTVIRQDGGRLLVETSISARVDVAFLTMYRFTHESREEWRDGRLTSLDAFTDDDGVRKRVVARAGPSGIEVDGPSGRVIVPADAAPSTFWHSGLVTATHLLDVQDGRLAQVRVRNVGATNAATGDAAAPRHFSLSGWGTDQTRKPSMAAIRVMVPA